MQFGDKGGVVLKTLKGLNLMKRAQYVDVQPLRGWYIVNLSTLDFFSRPDNSPNTVPHRT